MKGGRFLIKALALLALASSLASAYDPSLLQDFCVAIQEPNGVFVNGKDCKDPKLVTAKDFYFQGLYKPGNTAANKLGFAVTPVLVDQLLGLNTLGVSLARLDLAVGGLNPPIGQIHFEINIGKANAAAFATFSSQNPGVSSITNAVFGSNPPISLDVLTKAFQVNEDVIKCLQKPFRPMT